MIKTSIQLAKKSCYLLMVIFLNLTQLHAQDCATETTASAIQAFQDNEIQLVVNIPTTIREVPIKAWLIGDANGNGRLSRSVLNQAMRDANRHYQAARMRFVLCETENINSNYYYNFTKNKEAQMRQSYFKENVINIYFTNVSGYCGYAHFPYENIDAILMDNGCTSNGSTFSHELGHYFGLFHTHETYRGKELVNGNNCSRSGDFICDTPADPRLSNKVSTSCQYTGTDRDANNQRYDPNPRNLMSYARKNCRNFFTDGQISRIVTTLHLDRYYLTCGVSPNPPSGCNATVISCGQTINGTTSNGANNFESSDYRNCHNTNSSFNAKDKLYKIEVNSTSTLRVRLSGLSDDLDIFLLEDCSPAKCIAKSTNDGTRTDEIVLPNARGTYYIVVDGYRSQEQGAFNLRVTCGGTTPSRPDFYISNATISDNSVQPGQIISGECRQNVANASSNYSVNMAYVLSSNTTFGSSDVVLDTDVSTLSPTDSWDGESENLTIPSNISSGTWYILFVADYTKRITESNENNNTDWIRITVNSNSGSCLVNDNFDTYSNGANVSSSNSRVWRKWSSSAPDGRVSRDVAFSGRQSMEINRGQYGAQDVVLRLGNQSRGVYKVSWEMYINDRDQAYFNIQNNEFNLASSGVFEILFEDTDRDLQNKWVDVELYVDLDRNQMRLYFDNRRHRVNRNFTANLGGINFYAVSDAHFYLDNVCMKQVNSIPFTEDEDQIASSRNGNLGDRFNTTPTINKQLSPNLLEIFPNPASDQLNVQLAGFEQEVSLTLYNVMGQSVYEQTYTSNFSSIQQIDVSQLAKGTYLMRAVDLEGAVLTRKVVLH